IEGVDELIWKECFWSRPDRIEAEPFTLSCEGFFHFVALELAHMGEGMEKYFPCTAGRRARARFSAGPPFWVLFEATGKIRFLI
ncbi:MAG: hypothetical protein WBM55_02975, partial [Muriicola sp.]